MTEHWLTRLAKPDDLDACARLIAAYEGGTVTDWRDRFEEFLAITDGCMTVVAEDDTVIGYGRVQHLVIEAMAADPPLPEGYYLSGIVVAETHRRRGVARSLCRARITWTTSRADDVWFFTNRRNIPSRKLHQRVGFREVLEFTSPELDGGEGIVGHRLTTR